MAEAKLQCTVVTPERKILESEADSVVVPAHDGEVGILPGHARLLAKLGVGELRVTSEGKTRSLFVDGGFVQVAENRVTVLSDTACEIEEIDLAEVESLVESLRKAGRGEELALAHHRLLVRKRLKERFARS